MCVCYDIWLKCLNSVDGTKDFEIGAKGEEVEEEISTRRRYRAIQKAPGTESDALLTDRMFQVRVDNIFDP